MNANLALAAQDYLAKRPQLGARRAAASTIQTFGVTAADLAEFLRDHGRLLAQQSAAATTAASEVRYLGR